MSVRTQAPSYLCDAGHPIVAATAFHDGHYLFGHQCPADGRYWVADPATRRVADESERKAAVQAVTA